jgi:hypothetical protein
MVAPRNLARACYALLQPLLWESTRESTSAQIVGRRGAKSTSRSRSSFCRAQWRKDEGTTPLASPE